MDTAEVFPLSTDHAQLVSTRREFQMVNGPSTNLMDPLESQRASMKDQCALNRSKSITSSLPSSSKTEDMSADAFIEGDVIFKILNLH